MDIRYYVLVEDRARNSQWLVGKYKKRISHLDQGYSLYRQAVSLCDELTLRAKRHNNDDLVYSVFSLEL